METNRVGSGDFDRQAIEEWVAEKISQIIGMNPAAIDRATTFAAYGLTSSDAVGLSGELEEWLGRSLPETLLYEHPTVEQLSAALVGTATQVATAAPDFGGIGETVGARPDVRELDSDDHAVGIAGLACRFPGGANTPQLFWRNLADGIDTAADVPQQRWDAQQFFDPDPYSPQTSYTTKGAFVDDIAGFDAQFFGISPREAIRMDPQQRMLLETVWAAFEDAAIPAEQIRGSRTGVFVGMMADSRYANVLVDHGGHGELDDPYVGLGSASSVAAGRLSYLLDLRGPSMVVDTACSSSLVALHLAINSIRNGECDRAVVAGVSAIVHPDTYQQACKMRMLAADGRCKTFDAEADGFLLGEGCGAVVVERLADARARRHQVLAVVRGSAVNQDGMSNGLTAPNRAAQVAVIRAAQQNAGIGADSIDFVEAHGSGTQLGDAIEIGALTEVFGAARAEGRPLYVGAVKTNVGHLTGAAGMAGLIKTVLALNRGTIPRNLHLREPNPVIDWSSSPVRLPHENIPWPREDQRTATAGVSSFGWSGTNAHVIVSAPPADVAEPNPEEYWHILPLSGRSPETLTNTAHAMSEYLRSHPRLAPADVAATLQAGRDAMPCRTAIPFRTLLDAAEALDEVGRRVPVATVPRGPQPTVRFVLPGTGDQFVGMGRDLYQSHQVFRDAIDHCAEIAADSLGMDLRTALYSDAAPAASDPFAALRGGAAAAGELVTRIDLAHAVVFSLSYAAARMWQSYGVEPSGLLGYSLGEYSAACVAGVFEVEVALPLVVRRAQLVAEAEPGAMLTVATSADRVAGYLGPELSCAAINSPNTVVVAGTEDAIAGLEQRLAADETAARRVPTTRAMHSALLDPLRERLIELFDGIELCAPRIPFVSNLTGTWITDEQARDPGYWADQMCSTVEFAEGVHTLAESDPCVVIDLGAGQLASLVSQALMQSGGAAAQPTLRGSATRDPDEMIVARTLGRLWVGGVDVDWSRVGSSGTSISLPTYSFKHQQFWPEPGNGRTEPVRALAGTVSAATELFEPQWVTVPASADAADRQGPYLVFVDPDTCSAELARHLAKILDGVDWVSVAPGTEFGTSGADGYRIRPGESADYAELVTALADRDLLPRTVVHLWSASGPNTDPRNSVTAHRRLGFDSLMALAGQLGRHAIDGCRILAVTDHAQIIDPDDDLHPGKTTVTGPALTTGQEYPGLAVRTFDVVTPVDDADGSWDELTEAVVAELNWPGTDTAIARRGRRRLVKRFRPLTLDAPTPYVRDGGVYVITGGTGSIGLQAAAHLAAAAAEVKLVLLARTALPDLDDEESVAKAGEASRAKATAVRDLAKAGAEVLVQPCDIGDRDATAAAIANARKRFGPIDGVIHAAGVLSPDAFTTIAETSPEISAAHFRAKVDGTLALADALRGERPDFVVLLSSMSAVLGGIGFAAYAAANAFQDQFVATRGLPGGSAWRSACWDTWQATVQHGENPGVAESLDKYSFAAADALAVFDRLIAGGPRRAVVSAGQLPQRIDAWVGGGDPLRENTSPAPEATTAPPERTIEDYRRRLAELWQEALGVDQVGPHDNFFESGGNSLVGLQLINSIKQQFRAVIPTVALFEAPTIADMAEYLLTATTAERKART